MKVVVGLGNPGSRYQGTRHNVGYRVIDLLAANPRRAAAGAAAWGHVGRFQSRFQAQIAEMPADPHKVLLVKPETFMNLSGRSVREVTDFYQVPLEDLLVVCDDINLPLGRLRVRSRGTHGGHNGLRDIQSHLGSTAYPRLRIGVDSPAEGEAVEHVLGRFRRSEQAVIDDAVARAAQAVMVWIHDGIESCMNQYNG
jgi:peptidyl-tRNA hydrolase, PTH1 family